MEREIAKALPKHMSPERMMRVALTCLSRVPKLADCTPESFAQCLLSLSQWGLEPDGRRAHLIPYGRECTLIIDYKGLVELAYRSGSVRLIHADVVREGDWFEYSLGEVKAHTPWAFRMDGDKPTEAGEIVAAYCIVRLDHDCAKCEVMTRDEIDGIRKRSKSGQSGPWVTDYAEMAKKTAFRRVSKWLPLSAEVHEAYDREDSQESLTVVQQNVSRTESLMAKLGSSSEVLDD
jgi:recombination protein RecT